VDRVALDRDLGNITLVNLIKKVRKDFFGLTGLLSAENIEQQKKHEAQNEPQRNTAGKLIHPNIRLHAG
jgi:hypothetical protein